MEDNWLKELEQKEQELKQMNFQLDIQKDKTSEQLKLNSEKGTQNLLDDLMKKLKEDDDNQITEQQQDLKQDFFDQIEDIKRQTDISLIKTIAELKEEKAKNETFIDKNKKQIEELTDQVLSLGNERNAKESLVDDLQKRGKALTDESKKNLTQIQAIQEKIEQARKLESIQKEKQEEKQKINSNLQKEITEIRKLITKNENDFAKKDKKIQKLQDEVDSFKTDIKQQKILSTDHQDEAKKFNEKLLQENKKLERQKNEILQAVKKQFKLIDVLKKLKAHIESSKMLNLTEDEFIKAFDLNENI